MIIDAKLDYKNGKLLLIRDDGDVDEKPLVPPYFYVIVPRGKENVVRAVMGSENVGIEETSYTPIIYKQYRYEPDDRFAVLKVYADSPREIPRLAELARTMGLRVAASNVRYVIRNCFDHNVHFFGTTPLYYGFDPSVMERLRSLRMLVVDVESAGGKPILASAYWYTPFEEVRRDDVASFKLPEEADELQKLLDEAAAIAGHNILGYDIPVLQRAGFHIEKQTKLLFDTSVVLATHGSSLKVGSARSLLDVAIILKDDAGITDEEIELKRRVKGRVEGLSWEELVRYNANDVVLTAKILDVIFPFVAVVSAMFQVPPSEVAELRSGTIGEYYLLRLSELAGYIPEYREVGVELSASRVYTDGAKVTYRNILQTDVKMMYPSFVLANFIDPTLRLPDGSFDRKSGIGILYSAVKRLAVVRGMTKKLRKQNKLYEPLDAGVKAILNALAYGAQAKKSSLTPLGNPWCPSRIFYGTYEVQMKTIEFLRSRGIRVVYSDTDSFYIAVEDCGDKEECKRRIDEIVKMLNDYLAQWGLEADVEEPPGIGKDEPPLWDRIYIHSAKNYILQKGDVVIVKGSALHNLEREYTVEAVSVHELLRHDKSERLRLLREMVQGADVSELFVPSSQQVWRLISKDPQSLKRDPEKAKTYLRVLTVWPEKPVVALKKGKTYVWTMPHSFPIFALYLDSGELVRLEEYSPFQIVELRGLRLRGMLERLKHYTGGADLLVYHDGMYALKVERIAYVLVKGGKRIELDSDYGSAKLGRPSYTLEAVRMRVRLRRVNIPEEVLREVVFHEMKALLRQYNIL